MAEWFEAGYFKKDLLIRRTCDQEFLPLGQVESRYNGANPFRSQRHPPAFLTPPPVTPTISRPPGMGGPVASSIAPPAAAVSAPVVSAQPIVPQPAVPKQPALQPASVAPAWNATSGLGIRPPQPAAPPQPVMRTLNPIEQVIQLIQTSLDHQNVFKQLMQQITQLGTLPRRIMITQL